MPSAQERPTQPRDYGTVNAAWSALVAGLLAAAKASDHEAPPGTELPVLGLAMATSASNDGLRASFNYLCARSNDAGAKARLGGVDARAADVRLADLEAGRANGA
jgi:hypothetical protein